MNSSTSIVLIVVCALSVSLLVCAAGVGFFVWKNGGWDGAMAALGGGGGGSPGSKWKLTERSSDCDEGKTRNSEGACVPLTVDSPEFGGGGGKYLFRECPEGEYVTMMGAGYDEGKKGGILELKWLARRCSGGDFWSRGNNYPSSMDTPEGTGEISGNKYNNRYWVDPAKPGWDQVAYVTAIKDKSGSRVRAFGPKTGSNGSEMFGVNDNRTQQRDIPESDRKVWRCDNAGVAPKGKRYAIVGLGVGSGDAVDRFKVKCRLFDT